VIHEPVLEISCGQKQCAHTHRQTDTRRWPQDLTAYGAQVKHDFLGDGNISYQEGISKLPLDDPTPDRVNRPGAHTSA